MTTKPTYEELEQRIEKLEQEVVMHTQSENALRASEYKLNAHLQNTPIVAITWDLNFRVIEWNPAAEAVFGYSKEEALGKHSTELIIHDEVKDVFDTIFRDLISDEGGTRSTNENITKDGERIICDWYNTTLKDANGKVTGVASLAHDITDRKQAEEALQTSEKEYRSTLNDLLVGVVVHAKDTSILLSNPEAANILGLTNEQMSGKKAIDPSWNFIHEDSTIMKVEDYPVSKIFSEEKPLHDYVLGINSPDKDYVTWVIVNAIPVFSNDNKLNKVIVNFVDITDRKRVEEERMKLEGQLRQSQKMEAIGTLAGGIAHDFNNLLTPILGYAELVIMKLNGSGNEIKYLRNIEESARRAKDLVEKILIISRSSLAQTESVQLKNLVEEVLTVLRASVPPSIDIHQETDFDLPPISADPSQIYQVILNLCTNAIQAMQEGGELWIRLNRIKHDHPQGQVVEEFLCLSIQDNGCGMDAATLERIYEPFFTTNEKGEQRGTGLGLSIISSVVKQHSGHMEVESDLGAGTIFRVYFPILKMEEALTPKESESPIVPGNEHILFVDDEEMVNEMGTTLLRELGYKVTNFSDSREALRVFESNPQDFQLVITDYSMPHLTGPQLMEKIKIICSDIPTLLITGYSNLATPDNLQEWNCDGIITKPYDFKKLSQTVSRVLEKSKSWGPEQR